MHAGTRGPLLRRGHRGAADRRPRPSSRPTSTSCGPWATSRTAATCWRSWAGRPRRRPGRRRHGLGGRLLRHHLPAAARPRAGHGAHDAAPPGTHGGARAGRPRPGRRRPGRRGVRAGRASRPADVRYDGHGAVARPGTRRLRPPPTADPARRPRRDHGGARPPARPGHAPLRRPATPADGPRAELRGWSRFADGREPDALSLLFSVDAMPPATLMIGSTGWVPTLQMSAYVRARPAPGWLGIRMTAGLVADGMVDETCVLWDSRGPAWWRRPPSWPGSASPTKRADHVAGTPPARSRRLLAPPRRHPPRRPRRGSPTSSTPRSGGTPGGSRSAGTAASSSWSYSLSGCSRASSVPFGSSPRHGVADLVRTQKSRSPVGSGSSTSGLCEVLLWRRGHLLRAHAWGSRRSVPRTWRGATARGNSRPPGTGRAGRASRRAASW